MLENILIICLAFIYTRVEMILESPLLMNLLFQFKLLVHFDIKLAESDLESL